MTTTARVPKGEKLEQEMTRPKVMVEYEERYDVCTYIYGTDEAGRGPLVGSVVAGTVVFSGGRRILCLNDSERLSEKCREELPLEIKGETVTWNMSLTSPARIDKVNTLQVTYEVMKRAVKGLSVKPEVFPNDTVTIPGLEEMQMPTTKGDVKNLSIAAASILTEVTRDHMMVEYEGLFPEYGFAKHKGCGTAAHTAAIRELGPCLIHRGSLIKNTVQANAYK